MRVRLRHVEGPSMSVVPSLRMTFALTFDGGPDGTSRKYTVTAPWGVFSAPDYLEAYDLAIRARPR